LQPSLSGNSTPSTARSRSPDPDTLLPTHPHSHTAVRKTSVEFLQMAQNGIVTVGQSFPPLPPPPSGLPDQPRPRPKYTKQSSEKKIPRGVSSVIRLPPPLERKPVSLTNPPRKCVHQGQILQIVSSSNTKNRYLFLFNDILLIAKPMSEGLPSADSRFQVKDIIELKNIRLSLSRDKYDLKNREAGTMGNRKIPPILAEFIHTFDLNPALALNNFVQKRALHPDPISVAHLLYKTPELSKTQLALFLSHPSNRQVYKMFLDQCQFSGVVLDEALRILLHRLSLPSRASLQRTGSSERSTYSVDYLLDEFTKRWYEANANVVVFDASIAQKLVIAMIVLNAQLHGNEGARLVKDRDEVNALVRPRTASQPTTPTIPSIPTMGLDQSLHPHPPLQPPAPAGLDDLTAFPKPTRDSFVESFHLLDQQSIVPKDILYNIFSSISHQPLDIEAHPAGNSLAKTTTTTARKLKLVMVSPAQLPSRLSLKIPSDPITITVPVLDPRLVIHLSGRDLRCEPPVLEFGSHRSQSFRIVGLAPGRKTLTIQPVLRGEEEAPEQVYDFRGLASKQSITIERQFMRHTFQISLLNDLGTRRRYLFGATSSGEKDEWARVLTGCLHTAKGGRDASRLNEHASLEQAIGLQILKEVLLGVEASDEDELVPAPVSVPAEPGAHPIVQSTTTIGSPNSSELNGALGLGSTAHAQSSLIMNEGAQAATTTATRVAAAAAAAAIPITAAAATASMATTGSSPGAVADSWMCRMPRPGTSIPDRRGLEIIKLVEQNSLLSLMLGFMGALSRDRLERIRQSLAEDEEEYDDDDDDDDDDEEEEDEGEDMHHHEYDESEVGFSDGSESEVELTDESEGGTRT
ncbi:hypothetical protein BGW38_003943, partial [Lunasporangiospora selenospora]